MIPLGVTAVMLPELDFADQIALCRECGVTHYSIRPRIIADDQQDQPYSSHGNHKFDLTPARLVEEGAAIRAQLASAGMTPFGTLPAADTATGDDELKLHLEGSAAAGAGRVRVAPSPYPRGAFNYEDELNRQIERYHAIVALAKPLGQKIVIETHNRSLATSPGLSLNICRHFDPNDLGVIFDIANYQIEGAYQPNLAVAVIRDWIDHVHIGGATWQAGGPGDRDEHGFMRQSHVGCDMTESVLYLPDWVAALRDAQVNVPLVIEDFSNRQAGGERLRNGAESLQQLVQ